MHKKEIFFGKTRRERHRLARALRGMLRRNNRMFMLERIDGVRTPYRKYQYARNAARVVIQEADSRAPLARTTHARVSNYTHAGYIRSGDITHAFTRSRDFPT